ncbi:bifunctional adenosylcobinamide kinase/adenosylcobinamide-phosphate guanylyltransferase [Photobacterium sanguinicancri]|uniref:Bifunctional adenosylcobalamin biosynthesis protein n=1 Tax=Photobacterium sanguinicancri TaxID=875932 RepID=A0ABX4G0U0_9GAMM|nr:bifunctional adenosylcobinamide kinase/adenosylcobinamide-phosphate guanylyltransferase [Photobacterium sanguinicancri]MDO6498016.1 bifunctional adenosylcobinamide kinase/adenosylcobinamide-phosphate guanylyltransferase [Photobacterium sanguinicancri]OZS44783.1 bifunctional adenosylcobinamide kinase/adenosylcobinamide-phosphate guanylyltransferase [Photobacterium sanguinicancri]
MSKVKILNGIELVLGGARSGKSRYAEAQSLATGKDVIYIATAGAGDNEMSERIARHQQERPSEWMTVEEPLDLAAVIRQYSQPDNCLLVDCLTLWLTNCLFDPKNQVPWKNRKSDLMMAIAEAPGRIIMVSNEVGQGIVPMGEVSRQFVDESGWLHQEIAAVAGKVVFVIAGLPQVLKDSTV